MKTLSEQLTKYALYHRDPRNILTHFVGIPLIVFSILVLLSYPSLAIAGFDISVALVLFVGSILYYCKLRLDVGLIMLVIMGAGYLGAQSVIAGSENAWLTWGIGAFIVGWVFQFIGHFYEGKKPAFVDDIMGLMIGPLFVVAEALFMLGLFSELKEQIEKGAGPVEIQTKGEASAG